MPFSGVERGRLGLLAVFSRVAPGVVAQVRSPRRAVGGGYSIVASPAVCGEFAGDGDHDDQAGLASGLERVPAPVQPASATVGLGSYGEGFAFASAFEGDAQAWSAALMLGGLDQKPASVCVAGLGDRALTAALAA